MTDKDNAQGFEVMERGEIFTCEFCGEEGFHDLNGHVCDNPVSQEQSFEEWKKDGFGRHGQGPMSIPDWMEYAWDYLTAHYQKELADKTEDLQLIRGEHERIKGILHERTVRLAKYETGGGEVKSQWIPITTLPTYTKDTTCIVETSDGVFTDDWEPEWQEFEQMHKSVIRWMPLPPK